MGFYARILIRKVIINNGDFMIEELNKKLKSMYLEPKTKLRVDVDYIVQRLEDIVNSDHTDAVELLEELKENLDNHNERLEIENGN
jgi:hypothetical protein|tara:strand:+ start:302 stop:559 length:258 start_codon:yes stop_codon:yes gene_type:complete